MDQSALQLIENANLAAVTLCRMVLQNSSEQDIRAQAESTLTAQFMATGPILMLAEVKK